MPISGENRCIEPPRPREHPVARPNNSAISSRGGNPLASTAALTTLNIMEQDQLLANATTVGNFLLQGFHQRLGQVAGVVEIRGQGLIIGIELNKPCAELVKLALTQGLLINVTADNVIRLLPSLIFTQTEAQQLLDMLCPLVIDFLSS